MLLLSVIAVSLLQPCQAQTMPRHTVSAGSGNFESSLLQVSWSIGQSEPIESVTQPTVILHGGFQQYDAVPVSVPEPYREEDILIYPNPCHDYIILNAKLREPSVLSYQIHDIRARSLISGAEQAASGTFIKKIDLSKLLPGIYHLQISVRENSMPKMHSLKIIVQ